MSPSNNQCVFHSAGSQWLCRLLVEAITITITIELKKIKAIGIDLLQDLALKRSLATVGKIHGQDFRDNIFTAQMPCQVY